MYLNFILPGCKTWKSYWTEINKCWLDISIDSGKEPFASFHIGELRVSPTKLYQDRPNVIEFSDAHGITTVHFFVFTFDPFDILDFLKNVFDVYQSWHQEIISNPVPFSCSCDVKPPGIFSSTLFWQVQSDRILCKKTGKEEAVQIKIIEIQNCTPSSNLSHIASFKFKGNFEPQEYRCNSLDQMKQLLNTIYHNLLLLTNDFSAIN